ncbi:MAG: hypothetical protein KDI79_07950 [Anaerolineae bacterium]|nr:hypothetical protein [Anaerolineae bacterium]
MIVLPITLTLLDPILATSLGGDPNSNTSYPFIPGSLLRGALAGYFSQQNPVDLPVDPAAKSLFFNGHTCFLNAYPVDDSDAQNRMLPTPLAWRQQKGVPEGRIHNWSAVEADLESLDQPRGVTRPFCWPVGDHVKLSEPLRYFNVHNRRAEDRKVGRATEESGALFRYEALAPHQIFKSYILMDSAAGLEVVQDFLENRTVLLGGSRGAGYGRVEVHGGDKFDTDDGVWREIEGEPTEIAAGSDLTLTLLSDLIIRDEYGQYADQLTAEMINRIPELAGAKMVDSFKQADLVGGHNRKWSLPLAQTVTIRAGSVFVLQTQTTLTPPAILSLEARGLGERRTEGFGRVVINWGREQETWWPETLLSVTSPANRPQTLEAESQKLAKLIVSRMLQRKLDRLLTDKIFQMKLGVKGRIKASQLARLRLVVRNALPTGDVEAVTVWLSDKHLKRRARDQFETARIGPDRLRDWLQQQLAAPQQIWVTLGVKYDKLPVIGPVTSAERLDDDVLAGEYTLRLIDGVLARAGKEVKDQ